MIGNLKALGAALAAIAILAALTAGNASAQQGQLTSDGPVTLAGTEIGEPGSNALTMFGGKVECPGSTYTGHKVLTAKETEEEKGHQLLPSGSTEGTVTPHFNQANCAAVSGEEEFSATVTLNGCDVVLESSETISEGEYAGTGALQCPVGKVIEVDLFLGASHGFMVCKFVGEAQGSSGVATLTNTEKGTVEVTGAITNISGTQSGLCGSNETESGELHFSAEVTGLNEAGEATAIAVSD